MKPSILIRADGNHQLGLGHLVRCIALSEVLKEEFQLTFISKTIPQSFITALSINGIKCIKISESDDFINQISSDSIVVLDGYIFDTDYQMRIKSRGAKLVCIDDLHDKEFVADLIINHSPGITPQHYKAQAYTKFALGHKYTMLRSVFLEQSKIQRTITKVDSVMICFGGSDSKNLTLKTLEVVYRFNQFRKINIVTGAAYVEIDRFKKLKRTDKRITHYKDLEGSRMHEIMMETDIAIVPASGILLETICCNCIPLICFYVENQKAFHSYMKSINQISSFGDNSVFFQSENLKKKLQSINLAENPSTEIIRRQMNGSTWHLLNLFQNLSASLK